MDDIDESLSKCYAIGRKMIDNLFAETGGKGSLILGAMGVMLAHLELQHKNTIEDVVKGTKLILQMNHELEKLQAAKPPSENIN
jgi:hypothetical protein